MCSEPDGHPPIEPTRSGSATGHAIGLVAADGDRFAAFRADAGTPSGVGIIVLPDYHGLTEFYQELAIRFAEVGVDAVAIDYYGRTAEPSPRPRSFDYQHHAQRTTWAGLRADAAAAASHLRLRRHVKKLYSIGFCFGGRLSFLLGTSPELSMAGVIGFYGWPVGSFMNGMPAPADLASELQAPLLGVFGGADAKISADDVERFRRSLSESAVPYDIHVYADAPHSFFDRSQAAHAEASAAAWVEVRRFIGIVGS